MAGRPQAASSAFVKNLPNSGLLAEPSERK